MNKKIFKYLSLVLLLGFLLLYFGGNNIFGNQLTYKRNLTISQIEKFENDVKNGVKIDINDYVVKDKTHDNIVTNTNKKISSIIEQGFKKIFKYFLNNIDI